MKKVTEEISFIFLSTNNTSNFQRHLLHCITDMLSGTKIAGQLRKNSSGHATRIFAKKSRKFKIPAVSVKRFCKAVLVCRLRALKTSISVLGLNDFAAVFNGYDPVAF